MKCPSRRMETAPRKKMVFEMVSKGGWRESSQNGNRKMSMVKAENQKSTEM